ncbi:MAG: acyl-CoA desaturase [Acidobacteria bacterium]|nr:acyl-CoA desaturase [Acidobacteriota bacterium]
MSPGSSRAPRQPLAPRGARRIAAGAPAAARQPRPGVLTLARWFDTAGPAGQPDDRQVDWLRCLPFVGIHLLCLGPIWTGTSRAAVLIAAALYVARVFAITGFYHRYFSHRAFRASRPVQFLMALAGNAAAQRGPIWWAAHHRNHHRHAEQPEDLHSPAQYGFWRSHMLWFMTGRGFRTEHRYVPDLLRYPELRLLDRFDWIVPVGLLVGLAVLGAWLERARPALGATAGQMVVWGFGISTVAVYHATYTINSVAHRWGRRRFRTRDDSRNNAVLALVTLGEGWHNNHHHYPAAARQGFYWWEFDPTYYGLLVLSWLGLIRDLRPVPAHVLQRRLLPEGG